MSVLLADAAGRRRLDRARRLRAVHHPHLAPVLDVVPTAGGTAVVSARVDGPTLAVLREAKGPLTAGEIRTVLEPVAGAVAHLHRLGIVHGDISPMNILLAEPRRAVLVDLVGAAQDYGTPGFRAPETASGRPCDAAGDVWALAATAVWLAAEEERDRVERHLRGAQAARPERRCDATALAGALRELGPAEPVAVPDASALARASLRARVAVQRTAVVTRRRPRGRHRADGRADSRADTRADTRAGRRVGPRALAVLAVALGVVGGGSAAAWGPATVAVGPHAPAPAGVLDAALPRPGEPASGPAAMPARSEGVGPSPAADAARALVRERDAALNVGDVARLRALTVAGSPARERDAPLLRAIDRGELLVDGLVTDVQRTLVMSETGGFAQVETVTAQSAHRRALEGSTWRAVEAQPARCTILALAKQGSSWLLRDAVPCATQLPASVSDAGPTSAGAAS